MFSWFKPRPIIINVDCVTQPGDTVILSTPNVLTKEQRDSVRDMLLPKIAQLGVEIFVAEGGMRAAALAKDGGVGSPSREVFEAAARCEGYDVFSHTGKGYTSKRTQHFHRGWLAHKRITSTN